MTLAMLASHFLMLMLVGSYPGNGGRRGEDARIECRVKKLGE